MTAPDHLSLPNRFERSLLALTIAVGSLSVAACGNEELDGCQLDIERAYLRGSVPALTFTIDKQKYGITNPRSGYDDEFGQYGYSMALALDPKPTGWSQIGSRSDFYQQMHLKKSVDDQSIYTASVELPDGATVTFRLDAESDRLTSSC